MLFVNTCFTIFPDTEYYVSTLWQGGMKAVVWTDTFQAIIIVVGLLAVLIRGSIVTGGFAQAWKLADERGRIKFDE